MTTESHVYFESVSHFVCLSLRCHAHRLLAELLMHDTSLNVMRSAFLCVCRGQHHKHSLLRVLQHQNSTDESVWCPAVVFLSVTTCSHTGLKLWRIHMYSFVNSSFDFQWSLSLVFITVSLHPFVPSARRASWELLGI